MLVIPRDPSQSLAPRHVIAGAAISTPQARASSARAAAGCRRESLINVTRVLAALRRAMRTCALAAVVGAVLGGNPRPANSATSAAPTSGSFAVSDWTLRAADGKEVSLHGSLAKGPVLVSFWALWCNPCLRELPHLEALANETAGRLTVLAVNQDGPRSVARVRPYLRSKGIRMIVPLDTAGDVARAMQVGGILPCVLLYDARGREVYRNFGYHEGGEVALRAKVLELIGGAPPDSATTP